MRRTVLGSSLVLLLLFAASGAARAVHPALQDPPDKRIEITGFGGYQFGGCVQSALTVTLVGESCPASDVAFGGILAYRVRNDGLMGVSYTMQRTNVSFTATSPANGAVAAYRSFPVDMGYLHFVGELELPQGERFIPFIGLGVGAMYYLPRDVPSSSMGWFFSAAFLGGAKLKLHQNFGLRAQMTLLTNVISSEGALFCVSSGGLTCAYNTRLEGQVQGNVLAGAYVTF